MSTAADLRPPSAPALAGAAHRLARFLWTSNPFYVISAGLFLLGLRLSFGEQVNDIDAWALMGGLAGYTLLLAVTAYLLVRFARVWEDARTVLLLVVLMFLATSVTFDEALVQNPRLGVACCLTGLAFAVAVSEGLLRGTRLRLPLGFRAPYYLILALFFLYPLALRPLVGVGVPRTEALLWVLFGFSAAAGVVFLTLLPAVRRGPDYVADNGSPWRWPLYPWVLFGLLALAVPARAYLLCYSMDLHVAPDQLVFGPYFLIPFGFAVAVILLEIGLVGGHRGVRTVALLAPAGLLALALVGHRPDPVYEDFLQMVRDRLGGDPLWLTLLAAVAFYAYAAARRAPAALDLMTAALTVLAFVGPDTLRAGPLSQPAVVPLLAAACLLLAVGLRRRASPRVLVGAAGIAFTAALLVPGGAGLTPLRAVLAFHLTLAAALLVGAMYDDDFARVLREVTPIILGMVGFGVLAAPPEDAPAWVAWAYPLAMAATVIGYGLLVRVQAALVLGGLLLTVWLLAALCLVYAVLRRVAPGLDYLAGSLVLFAVAVLVSLGKSGHLPRWLVARGMLAAPPEEPPAT
jgi:hypothetical protein